MKLLWPQLCFAGSLRGVAAALAVALGLLVLPVRAQVVSLNDGLGLAQFDFGSQRGLFHLGQAPGLISYQLPNVTNQQWFWYRLGTNGPEASLDTLAPPVVLSIGSNTVSVLYSNAQVAVQLDYNLSSDPGGVYLFAAVTLTNPATTPLDFHLFLYSDFQLTDNDTIEMDNSAVYQSAGIKVLEMLTLVDADHWQVALSGTLLNLLTNTGPDTLNDAGSALGPGHVTSAWEWDLTLPPTNAVSLEVLDYLDAPEPPILAPIPDYVISVGQCLQFTNSVQGYYPPFVVYMGAPFFHYAGPAGASVDKNKVFHWCPTPDQAGTTNHIQISVMDNNMPDGWASQTFTVVVLDFAQASLGTTALGTGQTGSVPVTLFSSAPLTNLSFDVALSPDWLTSPSLTALAPAIGPSTWSAVAPGVWHANLGTTPSQFLQGTQQLATLTFNALAGQGSGFVPLPLTNLLCTHANGSVLPDVASGCGRVAVLGAAPLLDLPRSTLSTVTLYGNPGTGYALDYTTNLGPGNVWHPWTQTELSARSARILTPLSNAPSAYFRARTIPTQ